MFSFFSDASFVSPSFLQLIQEVCRGFWYVFVCFGRTKSKMKIKMFKKISLHPFSAGFGKKSNGKEKEIIENFRRTYLLCPF